MKPRPEKRRLQGLCKTAVNSEDGIVLILTLMILALITAVVVEFAYGVYTTTSELYNWRDSQRLSFVAKSGTFLAVNMISNPLAGNDLYKYLGRQIPLENVSEGFSGRLIVEAEDENSKFNLNSLVAPNGQLDSDVYDRFKKLLDILEINESVADKIAYWIDPRSEPGMANSENSTKNTNNGFMDSTDELRLIKGIDRKTYERLLPYVTVYGYQDNPSLNIRDKRVNMNTASVPVIMSLADISKESAQSLVNQRELKPFGSVGEAANIRINLSPEFFTAERPVNYRITSIGEENKIKRVIESVIKISGGNTILYWQEM
jgi:general secretion pathway protein K